VEHGAEELAEPGLGAAYPHQHHASEDLQAWRATQTEVLEHRLTHLQHTRGEHVYRGTGINARKIQKTSTSAMVKRTCNKGDKH